jgi:hypothetical protein
VKVIVNRDQGWPIGNPTAKLFDAIELEDAEAQKAIEAGYLLPAEKPAKAVKKAPPALD